MRHALFISMLVFSTCALAQTPGGGGKPLTREQLGRLVAAGMDTDPLAETVAERGLGFELAAADLESLSKAGAQPPVLKAVAEAALVRSREPIAKDLLPHLLRAGVDDSKLARALQERGVDLPLSAEDFDSFKQLGATETVLMALREANPKPLSSDQVLKLVAGRVPSERVQKLIASRGIDFQPTDDLLDTLRIAGADEALLQSLRQTTATLGDLIVETSPGAEIWLDEKSQGQADSQGRILIRGLTLGEHQIRVTLAGYLDFSQAVNVVARPAVRVSAPLKRDPVPAAQERLPATLRRLAELISGKLEYVINVNGDLYEASLRQQVTVASGCSIAYRVEGKNFGRRHFDVRLALGAVTNSSVSRAYTRASPPIYGLFIQPPSAIECKEVGKGLQIACSTTLEFIEEEAAREVAALVNDAKIACSGK